MDPVQRLKWLNAVIKHPDVTLGVIRVASFLAQCKNGQTGRCNPSTATIAKEANMNIRTVNKVTARMQNPMGVLSIIAGGGRRIPNQYEFVFPRSVSDLALSRALETVPQEGTLSEETLPSEGRVFDQKPCPAETETLPSGDENPALQEQKTLPSEGRGTGNRTGKRTGKRTGGSPDVDPGPPAEGPAEGGGSPLFSKIFSGIPEQFLLRARELRPELMRPDGNGQYIDWDVSYQRFEEYRRGQGKSITMQAWANWAKNENYAKAAKAGTYTMTNAECQAAAEQWEKEQALKELQKTWIWILDKDGRDKLVAPDSPEIAAFDERRKIQEPAKPNGKHAVAVAELEEVKVQMPSEDELREAAQEEGIDARSIDVWRQMYHRGDWRAHFARFCEIQRAVAIEG